MAALSPEEKAVFDALVAKQNEVVTEKLFHDVGDVLRYLVANSTAFTVNPESRQEALDVVNAAYPVAVNESN